MSNPTDKAAQPHDHSSEAKQEGSLIHDLQKILLQHELEKQAERKKNAELFDICKNLQALLGEATTSNEQDQIASELALKGAEKRCDEREARLQQKTLEFEKMQGEHREGRRSLESALESEKAQILNLQAKHAGLELAHGELSEKSSSKIAALESSLEKLRAESLSLAQNHDALKKQRETEITRFEIQLSKQKDEQGILQEDYSELKKTHDESLISTERKAVDYANQITRLEEELRKSIEELKQKIEALEGIRLEREQQLKENAEKTRNLEAAKDESDKKIGELQEIQRESENELAELEKARLEKEDFIKAQLVRLAEARSAHEASQKEIESSRVQSAKDRAEWKQLVEAERSKLRELAAEHTKIEKQLAETRAMLNQERDASEERSQRLQMKIEAQANEFEQKEALFQTKNKRLKETADKQNETNQILCQSNLDLEKKVKTLELLISPHQEEVIAKLKAVIAENSAAWNDKMAEVDKVCVAHEQRQYELVIENTQLKERIERIEQESRQTESRLLVLQAVIKKTQEEKDKNEALLTEKSTTLDARVKELQDYFYDQIEKNKKEIESLSNSKARLENEIKNTAEESAKKKELSEEQITKVKQEADWRQTELLAQIYELEQSEKKQREKNTALEEVKNTFFISLKKEREKIAELQEAIVILQTKISETYADAKARKDEAEALKQKLRDIEAEREKKLSDLHDDKETWKKKSDEISQKNEKFSKALEAELKRNLLLEEELRRHKQAFIPPAHVKEAREKLTRPDDTDSKKNLLGEGKAQRLELILELEDQKSHKKE